MEIISQCRYSYRATEIDTILYLLTLYRMMEIVHDTVLTASIDGDRYNAVLAASIDGDRYDAVPTSSAVSCNGDQYDTVLVSVALAVPLAVYGRSITIPCVKD